MRGGAELRLFGPTRVIAGNRSRPVRAPRVRTVLALLVLSRDAGASLESLAGEIGARSRTEVGTLCRALSRPGWNPDGWLVATPIGYAIPGAARIVDVLRFEDLATSGLDRLRRGEPDPARARLDAALDLWQGEPFADVPLGLQLRRHAHRLRELRARAVQARVDIELLSGRHRQVLPSLRRMVADDPLHEGLSARLMVCLFRCGRPDDAQDEYRRVRRLLDDRLGLAPSPRLRRLAGRLRDPDRYVDWQLVRADHREDPEDCVLSLLVPEPTTVLSGRDVDVSAIASRLVGDRPHESTAGPHPLRAVALSGPPGAGKTALALEVARRVAGAFPAGQLLVDLAGSTGVGRSVASVLRRLLSAVGVEPGSTDPGELAAMFRSCTATRRLLLILDDAASAVQVRALLPGDGRCAVLVTSTEQLRGLPGVVPHVVAPLAPAASVEVLGRLLGEKWLAEGVDEVVARCDGLPLALTVAARVAQCRGLSVRELAGLLAADVTRLRTLYTDDATVHARIRAALRRLDADSRRLGRRMARLEPVFPDTAIGAPGESADLVEAVLGRLLQLSMLRQLTPDPAGVRRFQLVDMVRLYLRLCPPYEC